MATLIGEHEAIELKMQLSKKRAKYIPLTVHLIFISIQLFYTEVA